MKPRGIRNKNPLNVKRAGNNWRGQIGVDNRGHAIFSSGALGVRAAIRLLSTYWAKYKLRTVRAIIGRWAPSSDTVGSIPGNPVNDPDKYTKFVAKKLGVSPDEELTLFEPNSRRLENEQQMMFLLAAMSMFELGENAPANWITEGVKIYRTEG